MTLPRFLLGLMLILVAVFAFKAVMSPLPVYDSVYSLLGESMGNVIGASIIGAILWSPVRLVRGSSRSPGFNSFVFYTVAILVSALTWVDFNKNNVLTNKERLEFAAGSKKTCISEMQKESKKTEITSSQLNDFCSCFSTAMGKVVTYDEVTEIWIKKTMPLTLKGKRDEINKECIIQLAE